jgi:hypothetical protein
MLFGVNVNLYTLILTPFSLELLNSLLSFLRRFLLNCLALSLSLSLLLTHSLTHEGHSAATHPCARNTNALNHPFAHLTHTYAHTFCCFWAATSCLSLITDHSRNNWQRSRAALPRLRATCVALRHSTQCCFHVFIFVVVACV